MNGFFSLDLTKAALAAWLGSKEERLVPPN